MRLHRHEELVEAMAQALAAKFYDDLNIAATAALVHAELTGEKEG